MWVAVPPPILARADSFEAAFEHLILDDAPAQEEFGLFALEVVGALVGMIGKPRDLLLVPGHGRTAFPGE